MTVPRHILAEKRDDYIKRFRSSARKEKRFYASLPLADRVRKAALGDTASGGRHRHQWHMKLVLLKRFASKLALRRRQIAGVRSFSELLEIVGSSRLKGVGELTVYDTAVRIGAGLGIEPTEVYLHAGTRIGARSLGWKVNRASIPRTEIPPELGSLSASEIEDLLCIYAADFQVGASKTRAKVCRERSHGCHIKRAGQRGC